MNEVKLFLESIKSEDIQYTYALKRFFDFVGSEGQLPSDRKEIEDKIIDYIIFLKKEKGMSYYGLSNYIVPIKSYYAINDVTLNDKNNC
jgi:hypothetical protein